MSTLYYETAPYLEHHGVKGMRWGVRRYQNYDGSYTQKGVAKYRKADERYENARQKVKSTKAAYKSGMASKGELKTAQLDKKKSKRELNKAYDHLKTDKAADQGKELYRKGKTITGNMKFNAIAQFGVMVGANITSKLVAQHANDPRKGYIAGSAVALGGTTVNAILAGKTAYENKKLRAYYGHSGYKG